METAVPFQPDFALGLSMDMKKMQIGSKVVDDMAAPEAQQVNHCYARFSLAKTLDQVCDVLQIPPEYALKVKAGEVTNGTVLECLKSTGREDSLTMIIVVAFLKEKRSLPDNPALQTTSTRGSTSASEMTHWIKAVEIGHALITTVRISCKEKSKVKPFELEVSGILDKESTACEIDEPRLMELFKVAEKIDTLLQLAHNENVSLNISHGNFYALKKYPTSFTGMLESIENFMSQRDHYKNATGFTVEPYSLTHSAALDGKNQKDEATTAARDIPSKQPCFYRLRVEVQPLSGSGTPYQYTDDQTSSLNMLYRTLHDTEEAEDRLNEFERGKFYRRALHEQKLEALKTECSKGRCNVAELISQLDCVTIRTEAIHKFCLSYKPRDKVEQFMATIFKVPSGGELDLLLIGKTGHGKSSTGNSILGKRVFNASSGGQSVTNESEFKIAEVDDRLIKVVDTPGVYDTRCVANEEEEEKALRAMSRAIAMGPDGFDALLLVISFTTRMTPEEKKAVERLKKLFGNDVLQSFGICIITHGDSFEKQENKPFEDWCKVQKEYLKDVIEGCNYRCVLFNNKDKNNEIIMSQRVQLINYVDDIKKNGPYRNDVFELAKRERERLIQEGGLPQLKPKLKELVHLIDECLNILAYSVFKDDEYLKKIIGYADSLDKILQGKEFRQQTDLQCLVSDLILITGLQNKDTRRQAFAEMKQKWGDFKQDLDSRDYSLTVQVTEKVLGKVQEAYGCFPGCSTVILTNGKSVTMEELQIGDKVLVRDYQGHLSYDTVYMFGHKELDIFNEFIILKTAAQSVSVTGGHYVYCIQAGMEVCVAAENVRIGDCLLIATSRGLVSQPVVSVTCERKQGLFAPFTFCGTIVVDQALMSCYVDVLPAATCHTLLWPIRQLYHLSPRALAFVNGSAPAHPVPHWVQFAMKFI